MNVALIPYYHTLHDSKLFFWINQWNIVPGSPRPNKEWSLGWSKEGFPTTNGQSLVFGLPGSMTGFLFINSIPKTPALEVPNALALKRCRKTSFRCGRIDLCFNWYKMNVAGASILSFDQVSTVHLIICLFTFPTQYEIYIMAHSRTWLGRFRVLKIWYSNTWYLGFKIWLSGSSSSVSFGQGFCWYNVPMVDE